jgi:hypothetical protein
MGAWGKGTFDNDIALDWAGCLNDMEYLTLIRETIAERPCDARVESG